MHHYPGRSMFPVSEKRAHRPRRVRRPRPPARRAHLAPERNWGYRSFQNKEALTAEYDQFIAQLPILISEGLAAAVYTQTTDVEIEVNGLLTYDRAIYKMDPKHVAETNRAGIRSRRRGSARSSRPPRRGGEGGRSRRRSRTTAG